MAETAVGDSDPDRGEPRQVVPESWWEEWAGVVQQNGVFTKAKEIVDSVKNSLLNAQEESELIGHEILDYTLELCVLKIVELRLTGEVRVELMLGGVTNWSKATITDRANINEGSKVLRRAEVTSSTVM